MIEYLRGVLLGKSTETAVVDVQGVGYGCLLTRKAHQTLPEIGGPVELHVYLYVQEGVLRLYGFASRSEREIFEVFINTSGIGPKTALAILSNIEPQDFAAAILRNDLTKMTKVPGIGKKTAERLVVELKDKLPNLVSSHADASDPLSPATPLESMLDANEAMREAMSALESLGCKPVVAERAVRIARQNLGEDASSASLVKEGLKHRY